MRRIVVIPIVAASVAVAGFMAYGRNDKPNPASASAAPGGPPAPGARGGARPPMPVEFATAKRGRIADRVLVVGNLIGATTVQAVPKVNGRLEAVNVKLGDPVRRGQPIAKVEDREILEQVRQADASFEVAKATIRQREADLKLAQTNLERNRSLLDRQLLPRQTYDDTDARYQAALAQVDLAKAQFHQAQARLEELKINLANTVISSPVDGFVGKRFLDPGATVSPNVPVAQLVDIRTVRMVANLVEKDLSRITVGTQADVEVDAFPGESFAGRVSRVAPIFDPATRTAEMEIEVPNPGFRLKPGMYSRVQLTVAVRAEAVTVPSNAVVLVDGKSGVFVASGAIENRAEGPRRESAPSGGDVARTAGSGERENATKASGDTRGAPLALTARFVPVQTGIHDGQQVEIVDGVQDGARVVTIGATALKDGDRIVAAARGTTEAPSREPGGSQAGTAGKGSSR